VVRLDRGKFEFSDETVELVDNEDGSEAVQPCLSKDSDCLTQVRRQLSEINGEQRTHLRANSLDHVHEDERSVAQSRSRRDFTREIDVPRSIDHIDHISFRAWTTLRTF